MFSRIIALVSAFCLVLPSRAETVSFQFQSADGGRAVQWNYTSLPPSNVTFFVDEEPVGAIETSANALLGRMAEVYSFDRVGRYHLRIERGQDDVEEFVLDVWPRIVNVLSCRQNDEDVRILVVAQYFNVRPRLSSIEVWMGPYTHPIGMMPSDARQEAGYTVVEAVYPGNLIPGFVDIELRSIYRQARPRVEAVVVHEPLLCDDVGW